MARHAVDMPGGTTDEAFDLISLHDARACAIERDGDAVVIATDFAMLGAGHPSNPHGRVAIVHGCRLALRGCVESTAQRYNDARAAFEPHPDPACPLRGNVVSTDAGARADGLTSYRFGGFYDSEWVEWTVVARGFTLSWTSAVDVWA